MQIAIEEANGTDSMLEVQRPGSCLRCWNLVPAASISKCGTIPTNQPRPGVLRRSADAWSNADIDGLRGLFC